MPKLAVLGQPVSHSRSPAMQRAALAELGLVPEWTYEAIEVAPEDFEALVRSLPERGFAGVNVTVPHKLAALALADAASQAARAIGAANTLTFAGARIAAENTDAAGLIGALGDAAAGKRALVLGAGGSARACAWALREEGAEVAIWNRTRARAEALAGELGLAIADPEPDSGLLALDDVDVLVNATTVGLAEANGEPRHGGGELAHDPVRAALKRVHLDADAINVRHTVVDLVYGSAVAPLTAVARERGARAIDGLEVLVHQGAASLRIWTGERPPIETMRRAARGI
jgi:shikimate dehydrogenase